MTGMRMAIAVLNDVSPRVIDMGREPEDDEQSFFQNMRSSLLTRLEREGSYVPVVHFTLSLWRSSRCLADIL
jgi:hypothetical protein